MHYYFYVEPVETLYECFFIRAFQLIKIQRCTFASWSKKMSIIPRCFINLDMAQASTAATAILRAWRDDRKILLWRDRLSQIRETRHHFQILSQPHASPSSANYPLETALEGWTWERNSSNKKRGQQSLAGGSLINESQKSASIIWEINEIQAKRKKKIKAARNVYLF